MSTKLKLALQNRRTFLKARFPWVEEYDFEEAWASDPSPTKKYVHWLLRLKVYSCNIPGGRCFLLEQLSLFHEFKVNLSKRDIHQFHSFAEFYQVADEARKPKLVSLPAPKPNETDCIFQNGYWQVLRLLTPYAARYYSQETSWCVSNRKYFYKYKKEGPVYVIISLRGYKYKYMLHAASGQFMQSWNYPVYHTFLSQKAALRKALMPLFSDKQRELYGIPAEEKG